MSIGIGNLHKKLKKRFSSIFQAKPTGEIIVPRNYPAPVTIKRNDGINKPSISSYKPSTPIPGYAPVNININYVNGKMVFNLNGQELNFTPGVNNYITLSPQGKVLGVSSQRPQPSLSAPSTSAATQHKSAASNASPTSALLHSAQSQNNPEAQTKHNSISRPKPIMGVSKQNNINTNNAQNQDTVTSPKFDISVKRLEELQSDLTKKATELNSLQASNNPGSNDRSVKLFEEIRELTKQKIEIEQIRKAQLKKPLPPAPKADSKPPQKNTPARTQHPSNLVHPAQANNIPEAPIKPIAASTSQPTMETKKQSNVNINDSQKQGTVTPPKASSVQEGNSSTPAQPKDKAQHKYPSNPSHETRDVTFKLARTYPSIWLGSLDTKTKELESTVKRKEAVDPYLIQRIQYVHAHLKNEINDTQIALANARKLMIEDKHLFDGADERHKKELTSLVKEKEAELTKLLEHTRELETTLKFKYGLDLEKAHFTAEARENTIDDINKLKKQNIANQRQNETKHVEARSKLKDSALGIDLFNAHEFSKNFDQYAKRMGSNAMNAQKPLEKQKKEMCALYATTREHIDILQETVAANKQILQENLNLDHSDPYVKRTEERVKLAEKYLSHAIDDMNRTASKLEQKFGFKIMEPNSTPASRQQTIADYKEGDLKIIGTQDKSNNAQTNAQKVENNNVSSTSQVPPAVSSSSTSTPTVNSQNNAVKLKTFMKDLVKVPKKFTFNRNKSSSIKPSLTPLPKGKEVDLRGSKDMGGRE
jgi:hypothetical protein